MKFTIQVLITMVTAMVDIHSVENLQDTSKSHYADAVCNMHLLCSE